ncbi:MAG TPA: methionyl-tRNA formyltransferase [Chthoniobacterales bacterium]
MRVVFIGTGEIGVPTLRFLAQSRELELVGVVTQPDRPVGREQRMQAPPIKTALADTVVPVFQPERIKRPDAVAEIRALAPDAIVVMAYGQILPRSVLEIPPLGCLNLHASLLPKYRGAAPIQAAIVAGETETGITVMYMDEGLDTGDMLLSSAIPISPDETGGSLHDRLAQIAPGALADALQLLANGAAPRVPQNAAAASYAPKLEREHGQIDWHEAAAVIERKIRAFDPWPGTFTIVRDASGQDRKMKIFPPVSVAGEALEPGEIRLAERDLLIGTGTASLRVGDVQLEGNKRMAAGNFVRGQPWITSAHAVSFSFPSAKPSA